MTEEFQTQDEVAQAAQRAKALKADKDAEIEEAQDIRTVAGTPAGYRILFRILSETGILRSTFTGNSWSFFKEGFRNHGLQIARRLARAVPDKTAQMMLELLLELEKNVERKPNGRDQEPSRTE